MDIECLRRPGRGQPLQDELSGGTRHCAVQGDGIAAESGRRDLTEHLGSRPKKGRALGVRNSTENKGL